MSKKYIGKLCVYCGTKKSTAGDHVIAREFFPADCRHGIPKVPACDECNTRKSNLEQYLMTVLPFASNHPVAQRVMSEKGASRLAKNQKLRREICSGTERVWVTHDSGLIVPTISIPFNPEKASEYFGLVSQGLLFHHWRHIIGGDYMSVAHALTEYGAKEIRSRFWPPRASRVINHTYAKGAFRYKGRNSFEAPGRSVWLIQIYGGLGMRGSGRDAGHAAELFFAMTGLRETFRRAHQFIEFSL